MHHAGLCHRDVTLANFLLPRQPPDASTAPDSVPPSLLYIIDFGLSDRFPARHNPDQDCSGTLRFATPYLGTAPLGPRDDLLSLGFVLLACLAGSLPWDGEACRACKAAQAKKQRSKALRAQKRSEAYSNLKAAMPPLFGRASSPEQLRAAIELAKEAGV